MQLKPPGSLKKPRLGDCSRGSIAPERADVQPANSAGLLMTTES